MKVDKDLTSKTQNLISYAEQKERNKLIKKAEKAVEAAEQRIAKLEEEIAVLETQLATQEGASDSSLCIRYSELKNKLTQAEDEWTEACMKVEEMMS